MRTFEYDATNRLSKVQVSQSAEAAKITYLHNTLGQRVFKSEPQVAQTAPSQTELGVDFITWLKSNFGWLFAQAQANATLGQSYVYDDSATPNLLGEYGNGGTKSTGRIEYIYLPTEDGNSIPIGLYKGGRFLAIHTDHLGTPRLITDDTSKPVWQWPYSAFGDNKPTGILKATPNPKAAITNQPQLLKATAATEINLRFPGQYFDEESNLNYNYFRSYQPTQGRYTQSDPIGLEGGPNVYLYANGAPLSFTDPLGLMGQGSGAGQGTPIRTPSSGNGPAQACFVECKMMSVPFTSAFSATTSLVGGAVCGALASVGGPPGTAAGTLVGRYAGSAGGFVAGQLISTAACQTSCSK